MSAETFERLKQSIIEAGKIKRGEMSSRDFIDEFDTSELPEPTQTWAFCLETDDEELLIPGKIYQVKVLSGGFWVRDEAGDATLCPVEFFLPVSLSANVTQKLSNLAYAV
ncbi:MAG: hypothetical protein M3T96_07290 [Acidobacteriota bacterium]|nr:hypothetical protein [Acidobacteriota bacterium]